MSEGPKPNQRADGPEDLARDSRGPKKSETNDSESSDFEQPRQFDLEDRTFRFAKQVRAFVRNIEKTVANIEDARQLIRASGSIGANYIEANEALGRKDFFCHIKISRKEAKETRYWLRLIDPGHAVTAQRDSLEREAQEFVNIFSAIARKSD